MLKVEKRAQSKPIHLSVRENARMLTPTFMRALALALALHFSAFILFHVQPFRLKHNSPQYPPVQVNIELALPDNAIFADLDQKKPHRFPEPPATPSIIPRYGIKTEDRRAVPKNMRISNPLLHIEIEKDLSHFFVALDPLKHALPHTPFLQISGPLANLPIVADSLPVQSALSTHAKKHSLVRLQYSVKVDSQTGKVFWYASNTQTEGKKIQKIAEDILERIQFNPAPSDFVTHGEIGLYLAVDGVK